LNALTEETIMDVAYDFPYEDSALQDELQEKIDEHFEQLGDKCQKVLKLFYYDGFTLEEIQKQLNYDNYNVVKSQKSRCLKTLKELISKHQNDR
jgi:RNA polymerase sigma factor (sigma-70 family)